ncbi:ShlB/FhaC/HecB family hemolysin secretion/activation protein [Chromobacterium vaccinii]|uniref:ShlB/FhaC/HecB family hemolysin secretion/activation protein n=1 Tax=Chromobacterium vaccinii TaxID=1108595 RepID=UPI003C717483
MAWQFSSHRPERTKSDGLRPGARKKYLTLCLIHYAFLTSWAAQANAAGPAVNFDSGQLLQQLKPPAPTAPNKDTPLTTEQPVDTTKHGGPTLLVQDIAMEGNTVFDSKTLLELVADARGKELNLDQLKELAARITHYYQQHGYPIALAYIPAQAPVNGLVRIKIVETRFGKITINNQSPVKDQALSANLTPLQSGDLVREDQLQRSLLLLSDTPGITVQSTLRPGENPGTSDLQVNTQAGAKYNGSILLDNTGNTYTGRARLGGTLQINNPLNQGDQLGLNGLTSSGLNYGRIDYQFPLAGQATLIGGSASYLDYHLKKDFSNLGANGTASEGDLWLSHVFERSVSGSLIGRLTATQKKLNDNIVSNQSIKSRGSNSMTMELSGDRLDSSGVSNMRLSLVSGDLRFDNDAAGLLDMESTRTAGHFFKGTLSLARLQRLSSNSSLYLSATGQLANKNLDSSEQFVLGGFNNIRAYESGAASGAQGYALTAELRHNFSLSAPGVWQGIAFIDSGRVELYRHAFTAGDNFATLSGAGVGLNWSGGQGWNLSAIFAKKIGSPPPISIVSNPKKELIWLQLNKSF